MIDPSVALAEQAYATLHLRFATKGRRRRGLFYEQSHRSGRRHAAAFNWSFAHAFAAAVDVYGLCGEPMQSQLDDLLAGLSRYWDKRSRTGHPGYSSTVKKRFRTSAKFYDDNAWSGLNLMRLHRMDPLRTELVQQASAVLEFALDEHRHQRRFDGAADGAPVGIHWQQQLGEASSEIGTVANAANAQLALRMYQVDPQPRLLDVALAMYAWVNDHMRDPATNLFWDHLTPLDNDLDTAQWSYNQGLMVGVNVLLFRATGDRPYHRESVVIAESALVAFDLTRLAAEPVEFAVILFRNLFLLTTVDDDAELAARIRRRAENYLQLLLPRFVGDTKTGVGEGTRLIEQAAIVEMIAMLCWPADRYDLLV